MSQFCFVAQQEKKRMSWWEYTKLRGYEIFDHHAPNLVEDESSAVYLLSRRLWRSCIGLRKVYDLKLWHINEAVWSGHKCLIKKQNPDTQ